MAYANRVAHFDSLTLTGRGWGNGAPAENLIHAGGSRCMGETDLVRDGGRWGARTTGERCGMVIDRAAATAADEQPGQRRGDPRAAPPALGPAAAARSGQGAVHPGRSGVAGGADAPGP